MARSSCTACRRWLRLVIWAGAVVLMTVAPARSPAEIWDGGGADNNWSTPGNWNPDGAPSPSVFSDIVLAGSVRTSPFVDQAWNVASLTFNPDADSFTLGGSQLTIDPGGITNLSNHVQTIANDILLNDDQTWGLEINGLTLNGGVDIQGHTLTINGTATFSDTLSGSGTLVHSSGTLTLGGLVPDAFMGNLTTSGTVRLAADQQIAATAGKKVSILQGGLFDLNGFDETIRALDLTGGTIHGFGPGADSLTLLESVTTHAAIVSATIETTRVLLGGGAVNFDVADGLAAEDLVITDSEVIEGVVVKTGTGTLVFRDGVIGGVIFSFTVNAGTVLLDSTALTVVIGDGAGNDTLRWLDQGRFSTLSPTASLTVNSSGVADLNGYNRFLPALTFNGGTLMTGSGTATVSFDTIANASATTATISGKLELDRLLGDNATRLFHVEDGSALIDLDISAAILESGSAGSMGFIKTGAGTLRFSGADANTYTGDTEVREGLLILNKSPGSYDPITNVETDNRAIAGDLIIGNATDAPGSAVVRLAGDEQIAATPFNEVTINRSGRLDLAAQDESIWYLNLVGGEVTSTTGTLHVLAGTISGGGSDITSSIAIPTLFRRLGGGGTISVADGSAATDLDISAALVASQGVGKTGPGTLRFSGGPGSANTYTGNTNVTEGVLELDKDAFDGAIPANLAVDDGVVRWLRDNQVAHDANQDVFIGTGAVLDLNGHSDTIVVLRLFGGQVTTGAGVLATEGATLDASGLVGAALISGNLQFNSATTTIEVGDSAADDDLDISAALSGGEVRKAGAGRLVFSGGAANTFSGPLSVDEGQVILRKTTSDGAVPGDVVLGAGTLVRLEQNEQIAATGKVEVGSGATLDLNGFNETLLDLDVTGGAVQTGAGTLTLLGTLSSGMAGGQISGRLDLGGGVRDFQIASGINSPLIIDAAISGGGIIQNNFGRMVLTGAQANTYTGTTTLNTGGLFLGKMVADGAIAGDLVIGDGAGLEAVELLADEQIAATPGTEVLVNSSGALRLNGFSETIADLRLAGGIVGTDGLIGSLTVNGQITADATATGSLVGAPLGLGGAIVTVNVADGAADNDLTLDSRILEAAEGAALFKSGAGQLRLAGSSANTYTGLTNVTAGTLLLAKPAGFAAVPGNLNVGSSGTVRLDNHEQIDRSPGRLVSVSHPATLDLFNFNEMLRDIRLTGGHIEIGVGTLTLLGQLSTLSSGTTATISGFQGLGQLDLNGAMATVDVADGTAAVDLEISTVVVNGGINKAGAGTLRLTSANTYAGGTTIAGGTLLVDNAAGSGTGSGAVLVQNTGRLGGAGSIAGPVTVEMGGTVAPGGSAGALSVDSVVFQAGASFDVEIGGTTPGTLHDVLAVTGSATFDGTLAVRMINNFVDSITHEDTFTVLAAGSLVGAPANVANGARLDNADNSGSFLVHHGPESAFGANEIVLSNFLLPPQTATWIGSTGNWFTASGWDIGEVPMNGGIHVYNVIIGSGSVTLDQDVTIDQFTLLDRLDGNGDLTVSNLNWIQGELQPGSGALIIAQTGSIGGTTFRQMNVSRPLVNRGTLTVGVVQFFGNNAGVIQNDPGATLILTPGGSTTNTGPSIVNDGTLQMTGDDPSDTFTHVRPLTNTGLLEVLGGTLHLQSTGTVLGGTVNVAAGAVLKLSGQSSPYVSVITDITGDGTVVLENGTTTFDNPTGSTVNNLVMNPQGQIAGSGQLTVNNLTWVSSGSMSGTGTTTVTGSATFVSPSNPLSRQLFIEGTLDWQNGSLFGTGTLIIAEGAQANLLVQGGTSGTTSLINEGTMTLNNPDPGIQPTFDFQRPLTNNGLIDIVEGVFIVRGTGSANSGDIQIGGGRLDLRADGFTSPGAISGGGEALFVVVGATSITGIYDVGTTTVTSGGTYTFSSPATPATTDTLTLTGGTIAGNPGITADTFTWTDGAISGKVTVTGSGTMNVDGTHILGGQLVNQGTLDWLRGPYRRRRHGHAPH